MENYYKMHVFGFLAKTNLVTDTQDKNNFSKVVSVN